MRFETSGGRGGKEGLKRVLSAWGLAAAVANITIGGGIFVLPAAMAKAVGPAAPLYYLICAGAVGAAALCFAEAGSRVAVAGGLSGCVDAAFGRYAGFVTASMLWLAAVLAGAGIASALADALGRAAPVFHAPLWRSGFILLLIASFAAINIGGVRIGGGVVVVTILLKLVPLLVLVGVGIAFPHPPVALLLAPAKLDIGHAMILGVFAFMGMETAMGVAGEVKHPGRNVPIAILGALAAVTLLYVGIQATCQGLLGESLKTSVTPLADAMGRLSPALAALLLIGAAVSMLGYLAADLLAAPRILLSMAEDGALPGPLARIDPRTRTPAIAIVVHAGLVALLAISGAFVELAVLSTLVTIVAYIAACAAAVILQRRRVATHGAPLNLKLTPAAAVVAIAAMVWVAAQGTGREIAAVAVAIVLASIVFAIPLVRKRSPRLTP